MTEIKFLVSSDFKTEAKSGVDSVVVVGAAKIGETVQLVGADVFTAQNLESLGVSGGEGSLTRTLGSDGLAYAIVGLGTEHPSASEWRSIGGVIGRALIEVPGVVLNLPVEELGHVEALIQGVLLGAYENAMTKPKRKLGLVRIVTPLTVSKSSIQAACSVAQAQNLTRDLAVMPANLAYPEFIAKNAVKLGESLQLDVNVWDEKQLKKDGFGLIAAVGMGSERPPRLVKLTYSPRQRH